MNRKYLEIGDSIKLLKVPSWDLKQREKNGTKELCTATVIEKIIKKSPIVIIDYIDEYKNPWFTSIIYVNGEREIHTIALMEDESWQLVYKSNSNDSMPKEHEIALVEKQIEETMEKYEDEYMALAKKSEKLYDENEALKLEYENLDKKSGLNNLFERVAILKEQKI